MIRALISQRQELNQYGDQIDSLEIDYVQYFYGLGITTYPVPNVTETAKKMLQDNCDLVILTGGDILPVKYYRHEVLGYQQDERNQVESLMMQKAAESDVPLLGICRGMQQINGYFGGKISGFKS